MTKGKSKSEFVYPNSLEEVLDSIWENLSRGASDRKHPFHIAGLTTVNDSSADVRNVVLRITDRSKRLLLFHTDLRSSKIEDLKKNPYVGWLFYDSADAIQVRIRAESEIHSGDDLAKKQWSGHSPWSKRCYCAIKPPGTEVEFPQSGLPENLLTTAPEEDDLEFAEDNFAAIATRCKHIDWLHLHSRGHTRARFTWRDKGWSSSWVIP
jgi:hypothetical protein